MNERTYSQKEFDGAIKLETRLANLERMTKHFDLEWIGW